MKRVTLFLCLVVSFASVSDRASAQSREELVEAYRRGLITQQDVARLRMQYNDVAQSDLSAAQLSAQPSSRMRSVAGEVGADTLLRDTTLALRVEQMRAMRSGIKRSQDEIYGHNLFRGANGGFAPNLNIATPKNYRLGAGDEIVVDVWGDVQRTLRLEVSPDGQVVIPDVGPVAIAGLTIESASQRVRRALSSIYEGLESGSVDMMLTLGAIRTIQVNVAGEVALPGAYTLPSLATLLHTIYVAGGVSDIGSLRNIKLYRAGREIASVDLYDYLQGERTSENHSVQDGDLVLVPAAACVVGIEGSVRRPMLYEMQRGETLADLVRFAGGYMGGADRNRIRVVRLTDGKRRSFTVGGDAAADFELADGDRIVIDGGINRYENRVELRGAVNREGYYAIDDSVRTLRGLIRRAGGLREDAFQKRALLYRESEGLMPRVESVDLQALMADDERDIELRPNDLLVVSATDDVREEYQVGIFGAVGRAGDYPYAENMTVEDLIVEAGGLLESASTTNVTISRRIKNPRSRGVQERLFETFVVDISDDLKVDGEEFVLEPFDQVFVRRSPVYIRQSSVEVRGEVAFEGNYPLTRRNMRLSEVVAEAGNPTSGAFVEGAYLLRRMTEEEQAQQDALKMLIENQQGHGAVDSLSVSGIKLSSVYPVGIDLAEALRHPGSDADVVLRNGDVVSIPQYNGTVRVMGAVMYPNSVTYKEGESLKHYVKAAGGFDNRARRRRAFVIYMNGMVESGPSTVIRPGCIVIVPSKGPANPLQWRDIVGLLSTSASTAAVVMSAINLSK